MQHSEENKLRAIKMVIKHKMTYRDVAKLCNCSISTLSGWVTEHSMQDLQEQISQCDADIHQLKCKRLALSTKLDALRTED